MVVSSRRGNCVVWVHVSATFQFVNVLQCGGDLAASVWLSLLSLPVCFYNDWRFSVSTPIFCDSVFVIYYHDACDLGSTAQWIFCHCSAHCSSCVALVEIASTTVLITIVLWARGNIATTALIVLYSWTIIWARPLSRRISAEFAEKTSLAENPPEKNAASRKSAE